MDNTKSYAVPIVVILAIVIIAGAIFYYKPNSAGAPTGSATTTSPLAQILPPAENINLNNFRPVDRTDKILGSVTAPVKLVVYTDLECPACKFFHQQLKTIEPTYVTTGKVAIIYRDFPLDSIHSKSRNEFLAAECANKIGGSEKFWQFVDKIFEITPSNNGLDPALLAKTAKDIGLASKDFDACMKDGKLAEIVVKQLNEATALGAQGTPFFLIVAPDNSLTPVFGGVPAERLTAAFNALLGDNAPVATTTSQQ